MLCTEHDHMAFGTSYLVLALVSRFLSTPISKKGVKAVALYVGRRAAHTHCLVPELLTVVLLQYA